MNIAKKIFKTIPAIAWGISGQSILRAMVNYLALLYFVGSRKLFKVSSAFAMTYRSKTAITPLYIFTNADFAVLEEIFVNKEYDLSAHITDKAAVQSIIDAGANIGLTTLYLFHEYPNARIVSLEPAPEMFKKLVQNTDPLDRVIAVNAALSTANGSIEFFVQHDNQLGSSVVQRHHTDTVISVESLNLPTVIANHFAGRQAIDIFKFDIEGAEGPLFDSGFDFSIARVYVGELHDDLMSQDMKELIQKFPQPAIEVVYGGERRAFIKSAR